MAENYIGTVEKMYTTKQLAELLGVSPRTVDKWRELGTGPSYKRMGNHYRSRVRYPASYVVAWQERMQTFEQGTVQQNAEAEAERVA